MIESTYGKDYVFSERDSFRLPYENFPAVSAASYLGVQTLKLAEITNWENHDYSDALLFLPLARELVRDLVPEQEKFRRSLFLLDDKVGSTWTSIGMQMTYPSVQEASSTVRTSVDSLSRNSDQ